MKRKACIFIFFIMYSVGILLPPGGFAQAPACQVTTHYNAQDDRYGIVVQHHPELTPFTSNSRYKINILPKELGVPKNGDFTGFPGGWQYTTPYKATIVTVDSDGRIIYSWKFPRGEDSSKEWRLFVFPIGRIVANETDVDCQYVFIPKPTTVPSCTIEFVDRAVRVTARNISCSDPHYRLTLKAPGWTSSVTQSPPLPCTGEITFTQGPKDARWVWREGTYIADIFGNKTQITCTKIRDVGEQGTIGNPGDRFSLPEDPTHFKGLPLFALFGGGLAPGAIGLLTILLVLGLLASFLFFVLGAFKYMVSRGDPKQVEAARNQITSAIIGLVIMAASFFIVQVIQRILGIQVTG